VTEVFYRRPFYQNDKTVSGRKSISVAGFKRVKRPESLPDELCLRITNGIAGSTHHAKPPGSPPMNSQLNGTDYNILKILITATPTNWIISIPVTLVPGTPILELQAKTTRIITMTGETMMTMVAHPIDN
jgi:hypothetical protein